MNSLTMPRQPPTSNTHSPSDGASQKALRTEPILIFAVTPKLAELNSPTLMNPQRTILSPMSQNRQRVQTGQRLRFLQMHIRKKVSKARFGQSSSFIPASLRSRLQFFPWHVTRPLQQNQQPKSLRIYGPAIQFFTTRPGRLGDDMHGRMKLEPRLL